MKNLPTKELKSCFDSRYIRGPRGNATAYHHVTLRELAGCLERRNPEHPSSTVKNGQQNSASKGGCWTGTESIEEYAGMLKDGWAHGVEGMEGLDGLTADDSLSWKLQRDVAGFYPDVPSYLAGHPANMYTLKKKRSSKIKSITLVLDMCFHAGINQQACIDQARELMKLVNWFATNRYDINVYATIAAVMHSNRHLYVTPVRTQGEKFNPERIAAALHTSFLRRGWFAAVECDAYEGGGHGGKVASEYGQVETPTLEELRQVLPDASSVVVMPKPGMGDPKAAIERTLNLKIS